jgi:C1A family cysteine protease
MLLGQLLLVMSAALTLTNVQSQSIDLRPTFEKWGLVARRQGNRGTCSVFVVVGAMEYAVAQRQQRGTRLSVEFLNWAGHKAVNRTADGGFFHELWKGYETFGICAEEDWPYQSDYDVNLQPSPTAMENAQKIKSLQLRLHWIKEWDVNTGLTDAQFAEIKRTLNQGFPVCGGFRWPKQARWKEGVLQMCPPEDVFDGHSVLLVGYRDDDKQPGGGVFIIRNSGGNGSDGYLPYEYVRAYLNDAAWVE